MVLSLWKRGTWAFTLIVGASCQAELRFEQPEVKLGRVKAAGTLTHRFVFQAVDGPVQILEIRPSCGCLRTAVDKDVLSAGERGVIPMFIHTASQVEGTKRFQLTVRVRDPIERTIVLAAEVTIESEIRVEPSNIIAQIDEVGTWRHTLVLKDRRPRPGLWKSVVASRPEIKAQLRPADADSRLRYIDVELRKPLPEGKHEERLVIRGQTTEIPGFPEPLEIEIPVTFVRPGVVTVIPNQLSVDEADLADGRVLRHLVILDRNQRRGSPRVTSTNPHIKASCHRESAGVIKVRLEIHPGAQTSTVTCSVDGGLLAEVPLRIHSAKP